jgi:hypothetical protein
MVAAVTVAADPILVLGPALTRSFGFSVDWSGVFITALGAGNVIGSFRRTQRTPSIRWAATVLSMLSRTNLPSRRASPRSWRSVAACGTICHAHHHVA